MSERDGYEPGTPSWVDLSTPDPAAAKRFYGELFGWEAMDAGPPEETGGYAMFTLRGKLVAGVGPLMDPGQPAVWSTYVATDDADATVARARDAGGQAIVEPMDVMDAGRITFVMHPAGGAVGLWQAGRHRGAQLVNEPGALAWNQLHTRDRAGAAAFYAQVFGWTVGDFGGMGIFNLGENGIGGLADVPPGTPDEVPAFWMTVFGTDDADAAAAKAEQLGGGVLSPPADIPDVGRFAVLTDPQGVAFGVIAIAAAAA
jgi:predicted enzyme related to lactoylglutathione lyase